MEATLKSEIAGPTPKPRAISSTNRCFWSYQEFWVSCPNGPRHSIPSPGRYWESEVPPQSGYSRCLCENSGQMRTGVQREIRAQSSCLPVESGLQADEVLPCHLWGQPRVASPQRTLLRLGRYKLFREQCGVAPRRGSTLTAANRLNGKRS